MTNLTIRDAFKALEDVEDLIEVKPVEKKRLPKQETLNETFYWNTKDAKEKSWFKVDSSKYDIKDEEWKKFKQFLKDNKIKNEIGGDVLYFFVDQKLGNELIDATFIKRNDLRRVSKKEIGEKSLDESIVNEKPIDEEKLVEEPMLEPEFDSRKSFYGKAITEVESDGTKVLYSYGSKVCKITPDGEVKLLTGTLPETRGYRVQLWKYSPTTLRHVKEFLKQNGFKADSISQIEKDYVVESLRKDTTEVLKESTAINVADMEEVEKGKEELNSEDGAKEAEKIVDVDAETIDELKDSYIGNVVLRCPVCRTLLFKKPDLLKKCEEETEEGTVIMYNCDEECPHCGSEETGFELVGQIATYDVEVDEKEEETTGAPSKEEIKDEVAEDELVEPVVDKEEEKELDIEFESLDESRFDSLINKYVHNIYENVLSYKTVGGSIDEKSNKFIVEGIIKYKSGKELKTKFIFEAYALTKGNKIKFKGLNETFTKSRKPFTLVVNLKENNLLSEELHYNYNVKVLNEVKKVKGKVSVRSSK